MSRLSSTCGSAADMVTEIEWGSKGVTGSRCLAKRKAKSGEGVYMRVLRGEGDLRAGEKVRDGDGCDGARRYSPSFHSRAS